MLGIANFVSLRKPTYDLLVKEFYANFTTTTDDLGNVVIKSKVNGVEIHFEESDLASWFELNNEGYKCNGSF